MMPNSEGIVMVPGTYHRVMPLITGHVRHAKKQRVITNRSGLTD